MRAIAIVPLLLVVAALSVVAGHALSQEESKAPDQAETMRLWLKYATPGERHAALQRLVGKWDVESEMIMPGSPPLKSKGEAEYGWLMEGRWLRQDYHGLMMGMPFRGFALLGWDDFKQKYVGIWCDSMSTALATMEGVVVDPRGETIVLYGLMDEFLTGERDKLVKYVFRFVDDDTMVFEIWDMGIGASGATVMRLTYRRRKA